MKKTLTINISGTVFHIDDDAYEKLKKYLSKIGLHFSKEEGGHEIINDIEARISELFTDKTSNNQNVVNLEMVDQVIEIMGLPEDFEDEEEPADTTQEQKAYYSSYKKSKRLYRDPESRVLGGVCGGLSHYLNIDKVLMRILFFILFIVTSGVALPAYLILWIAVPKARTTSQKLEMKGEDINVDSIGKTVKEEFSEMKDSYNRYKESDEFKKGQEYARTAGRQAQNAGREAGNVLSKVFGAIFLFIGFISLIGLTLGLLTASNLIGFTPDFLPNAHSGLFVDHIFSSGMATTLIVSAFIIAGIPLLLIIYAGAKMVFNFVSDSKTIILSALGIWIIGIILAVVTSLGAIDVFSSNASVSDNFEITSQSDTLYISIDPSRFEDLEETRFEVNNTMVMMRGDEEILVSRPKFTIEPTSEEVIALKIRKESKGNNYRTAKKNAEEISFNYTLNGDQLLLDPYFFIGDNNKWRNQEVSAKLKLPKGKVVFLNDELLPIIYDIENTTNTWDGDMVGEFWQMKPKGLTLIN